MITIKVKVIAEVFIVWWSIERINKFKTKGINIINCIIKLILNIFMSLFLKYALNKMRF